jgi:hypothetical protein
MRPKRAETESRLTGRLVGYVCLCATLPMLLCVATDLLAPKPGPDCRSLPMITGEKIMPSTLEAPPPTQVYAGQPVTVRFSGGYVFRNYGIDCQDSQGEYVPLGYAHRDRLASSQYTQTVSLELDDSDAGCAIRYVVPAIRPYYAVECGSGDAVGYISQGDLPRSAYSRIVRVHFDPESNVYLDNDPLVSTGCEKDCTLDFVIPTEAAPGTHALFILLEPLLGWSEFEIEVVQEVTPTP